MPAKQQTQHGLPAAEQRAMLEHLAAEIRHRREALGMTREQLAALTTSSPHTVASYESGHRPLNAVFVFQADDALGADRALLRLWDRASGKEPVGDPNWYFRMEAEAAAIRAFEPNVVHSLLQTPTYARSLFALSPLRQSEEQLADRVARRMERAALLDPDHGCVFTFVMDEAALQRMPVGADSARRQLEHVLDVGIRPNVSVLVVPFSAGLHLGLNGAFSVFSFDEGADAGYAPSFEGSRLILNPARVRFLREVFEGVLSAALPRPQSEELIKSTLERL
ncbi:helix-turn-helix domain-containing protein [Yinghuangia soli]|uniref:Helix-turn-helix transcriptional regulator n=1 Tax=Yinghuangia soli TaxID=2908204 RepID=A0AA41QB05_9ACTN|nr:helix-turn-helix transcriptional regulator [Yinghuangia soli]MCF2533991.1 helix-turn-helix transcriptional regulator [Yinghuangia soli]